MEHLLYAGHRVLPTTHWNYSYQMRKLRLKEGRGPGQGVMLGARISPYLSSPLAPWLLWAGGGGRGQGAYTSSVQGSVSFSRTWSSEPTWRSLPWMVILVPPALGPMAGSRE